MTREEAIKIINCYDIGFYDLSGAKIPADKLADAFDMAIEALSAVCDDCIWHVCNYNKIDWDTPSAEGGDAEVNPKSPYMQQSPNSGADLISRADALKEIEAEEKRIERDIENARENPNNYTDNFVFAEEERVNGLADAYIIIDGLPSAEAIHGEWIITKEGEYDGRSVYKTVCSECGHETFYKANKAHFCPNCGARMEGGDDE